MTESDLKHYTQHVTSLKKAAQRHYDRSANKDLSQQQWQGLFGRNVTLTLNTLYEDALPVIQQAVLETNNKDDILAPFTGVTDELAQYALQKHRTSCAFSNFPDEHTPSQDYISDTLLQAEKDWSTFCEKITALIQSKTN